MTDGPFNNLKLSRHWKLFLEAALNDVFDSTERCARASNAFVREILTEDTQDLIADLLSYADEDQWELDPLPSVQSIFNDHYNAPFVDTFRRELMWRLGRQPSLDVAIREALEASVGNQLGEVNSRIEEECIRISEDGELPRNQYNRALNVVRATFSALHKSELCDVLLAGDKAAFKKAAAKKVGREEGPRL